jgi:serine/threonine protein kinase/Tol biopolymer transport system component
VAGLPVHLRVGPYEIVAQIGAGGMGEVYRAHDSKLKRDVAIKLLPQHLTGNAEHLARFGREAQVLAALNHPHIAQIYGVEEIDTSGGGGSARIPALILEFVAGQTLAERLAQSTGRGASKGLPIGEALSVAKQIAAALEAAHDKGIIHRDLKPANVKITPAGVVKVLDFGIAKIDSVTSDSGSDAPTLGPAPTQEGTILGTPAYMSPEQIRGVLVDKRTDVWAFGCVLYEALSGRQAFQAASTAEALAAALEREPDWTRLPPATPPSIRQLLMRCLQKDAGKRLRDFGDIQILIDDAFNLKSGEAPSTNAAEQPHRRWLKAAGVFVSLAAIVALAWDLWMHRAKPAEIIRVSISTPGPVTPQLSGIISPDGRNLAFVATGPSGKSRLWVRSLDSLEARELPGTDRAAQPFWSPDGRSIGFFADAKLKRMDLPDGPVQILTEAPVRSGASWSAGGLIVFARSNTEIAVMPAAGGSVSRVVSADPAKQQNALLWPDFLPDGRHFLYIANSRNPEFDGVYAASLDSDAVKMVLKTDIQAKYAPPGYLLYLQGETLMAKAFDAQRLEVRGEPSVIADGIWLARGAKHASFSASQSGALAYVNASLWNFQLTWFDRKGVEAGKLGAADRYANVTPHLSPDGRRIAITRGEWLLGDLWLLDASRGTPSRLTFGPEHPSRAIWSTDSRRILFQMGPRVITQDLERSTQDTILELKDLSLGDWSHDGRYLVLNGGPTDLWAVDLSGDKRPFPFLTTPANKAQGQLSPDSKWIAYTANESGRDEVYIQSFPTPGRKLQVSIDGGVMPRWRRDGKELFYLAANQYMMSVPVKNTVSLELDPPVPLFRTRLIVQGSESTGLPTAYDVSADGQRFLLNAPPEDLGPPMTVVLNWTAALKK